MDKVPEVLDFTETEVVAFISLFNNSSPAPTLSSEEVLTFLRSPFHQNLSYVRRCSRSFSLPLTIIAPELLTDKILALLRTPSHFSLTHDFCTVHYSQAFLGRKHHFQYQLLFFIFVHSCAYWVSFAATSDSLYCNIELYNLIRL